MAKIKNCIGVDFGLGGIKLVNLSRDKKPRLVTYGFTDRSPKELDVDWLADPAGTGVLVRKICDKAKVNSMGAVTALPIASVFSSVISLPISAAKELEAAVRWEAKKLIPLPLEEVVLDWKRLAPLPVTVKEGEKPKEQKTIEVLLTGAPQDLVQKYVEIFKKAGLSLLSLETESFAFIRSLVGNDPSPVAIVDIGAKKSNIVLVDRGIPFIARSVEVGGKNFTDSVARVLNVPVEQAEEIKRNIADSEAMNTLPALIKDNLTPLLNEIKYSLNVYRTRNEMTRPIEKIILTGGSALLPKLSDYFNEFFNLRTFLGDPWARLSYPADLTPLLQAIGARFSVAIGLGLREVE